jgi:hypothetical protein
MSCPHCEKELTEAPPRIGNEEKAVASRKCGIYSILFSSSFVLFVILLLSFLSILLPPHLAKIAFALLLILSLLLIILLPLIGLVLGILGLRSKNPGAAIVGICLSIFVFVVVITVLTFYMELSLLDGAEDR